MKAMNIYFLVFSGFLIFPLLNHDWLNTQKQSWWVAVEVTGQEFDNECK